MRLECLYKVLGEEIGLLVEMGLLPLQILKIELTVLFVGDGGGNARIRAFVNNQNVSFFLFLFFFKVSLRSLLFCIFTDKNIVYPFTLYKHRQLSIRIK